MTIQKLRKMFSRNSPDRNETMQHQLSSSQPMEIDRPERPPLPKQLLKFSVFRASTTGSQPSQRRICSVTTLSPRSESSRLRKLPQSSLASLYQKPKDATNSSVKFRGRSMLPCDLSLLPSNFSRQT